MYPYTISYFSAYRKSGKFVVKKILSLAVSMKIKTTIIIIFNYYMDNSRIRIASYSIKKFSAIMQTTKICSVEILIDENYLRQNLPDLQYICCISTILAAKDKSLISN